ncbi:hypothetical protein MATL_G00263890 [Megalops atlanticus]|uniref:MAM domain-containing protein n=1 Tax=Megalops atlanticus TaxID=7932 RepID=A0A9D3SZF4_MEGAT|nr:hypothetical protein MATL_G00263890 [Megalops atlanticus]
MDYFRRQPLMCLALYSSIVTISCHALLDRSPDESVPARLSPHIWNLADVSQTQAVSCDFEWPCSWILSNHSGRVDWHVMLPQQRGLSVRAVQPTTDHSVGGPDGHFLILTAVEADAAGNCEFSITSPVLSHSGALCCLKLAMFQPEHSQGNLSVQLKLLNSASVVSLPAVNDLGQNGTREQWEVLEVQIGQLDEPFQVTLLYSTCGEEDRTTLAIDSLELKNCDVGDPGLGVECVEGESFHCDLGGCIDNSRVCNFHRDCPLGEDEGVVCDALPMGAHCSFDSGPCGWTVSGTSSTWTLTSGAEMAASEDLLGITLQNTEGNFLFLKLRDNKTGGEALAQSPALPPTAASRDCQIQFSLYLFGKFNGTVLLSVEENVTAAVPLVWERSGQRKDSWQNINLELSDVLNSFSISLRVQWGWGSSADIAMDQISLGASCFDTGDNCALMHKHTF